MAEKLKSFVSENEIEDKKKKRQEEWEKVRKPDEPLEAPEEEYDPRSLYDRLQEQKNKKDAEYEEVHKLRNLIRGLDDDEVAFLELVDKAKSDIEEQRMREEWQALQDYRSSVASLGTDKPASSKVGEVKKRASDPSSSSKMSQSQLLAGVVKRKSDKSSPEKSAKRPHLESEAKEKTPSPETKTTTVNIPNNDKPKDDHSDTNNHNNNVDEKYVPYKGALHCLGVLPGLSVYSDSSDSENSSIIESDLECAEVETVVSRRFEIVYEGHDHCH